MSCSVLSRSISLRFWLITGGEISFSRTDKTIEGAVCVAVKLADLSSVCGEEGVDLNATVSCRGSGLFSAF